jgi:hypothetical protein
MVNPAVIWNPAAIRFWPNDGTAVSWPPPKYLGNDAIQIFIKRFGKPIDVPIPRW